MAMTLPFRKSASRDTGQATSFRDLYTRVLLALQPEERAVLGVTSAIAGEGKTTIAAGLAAALAQDGAFLRQGREPGSIALVECGEGERFPDLRLAVPPGPGLAQVLRGDIQLDAAIRGTAIERLSILPIGDAAHSLPLLIRAPTLPATIAQLRSRFDLVLLDLPPVLPTTDARVLSRLADRLILVVRAGVTPAKLVGEAIGELGEDRLLGVVLNDTRRDLPSWLDQRL
jgi:Mrp family chromosome partitioning ATPase